MWAITKWYKRVYTSVTGKKIPMEYYVLEENLGKAEKLLDLFEQSSRILEKYFGEYPWANERIAASETPHLGMEHQTNIAYGNKYRYEKLGSSDFDWLLHHEYGHEWWANKVTPPPPPPTATGPICGSRKGYVCSGMPWLPANWPVKKLT